MSLKGEFPVKSGYEPKKPDRKLLNIANIIAAAGLAAIWFFHEKIGLEAPSLFALTGIALACFLLLYSDRRKVRENYRMAELLKKQREEISKEDFSDKGEIFFETELPKNNKQ